MPGVDGGLGAQDDQRNLFRERWGVQLNLAAATGRVAKVRGCWEAVFPSRPTMMHTHSRAVDGGGEKRGEEYVRGGMSSVWERVEGVSDDPQVSVQRCPH